MYINVTSGHRALGRTPVFSIVAILMDCRNKDPQGASHELNFLSPWLAVRNCLNSVGWHEILLKSIHI
jgi:hypothetical protein